MKNIIKFLCVTMFLNMIFFLPGKTNLALASQIIKEVPFNTGYVNKILANSISNKVYLIGNTLTVLDGKTDEIISEISTDDNSSFINFYSIAAVDPVSNKFYILGYPTDNMGSSYSFESEDAVNLHLYVVDGISNKITNKLLLPCHADELVIKPGTNKVWLLNYNSSRVYVINDISKSFSLNSTLELGIVNIDKSSLGKAIYNPNNNKLYVLNSDGKFVYVLDGDTNTLVKTITLDSVTSFYSYYSPISRFAFNASTNKLYVANINSIFIIDANTNTVTDKIKINSPAEVIINSATNKLYVTSSVISSSYNEYYKKDNIKFNHDLLPTGGSLLNVIDLVGNKIIDTTLFTKGISNLAINQELNKIYSLNTTAQLVIINGSVNNITEPTYVNQFREALNILNKLHQDLLRAPGSLKKLVTDLGNSLSVINAALEDKSNACDISLAEGNGELQLVNSTISTESRRCCLTALAKLNKEDIGKSCLLCSVVKKFLQKLQEPISTIDALLNIDSDGDGVADICTTFKPATTP